MLQNYVKFICVHALIHLLSTVDELLRNSESFDPDLSRAALLGVGESDSPPINSPAMSSTVGIFPLVRFFCFTR